MKPPAGTNLFRSRRKLLITIFVITGLLLVFLSAGIGIWKLYYSESNTDTRKVEYQLPDFVYAPTAPANVERAYLGALEYPEELSHIPCYCGCGHNAGHKSVLDCYIASRDGDDIVFDRHGAG
jgi:hypothetical protein